MLSETQGLLPPVWQWLAVRARGWGGRLGEPSDPLSMSFSYFSLYRALGGAAVSTAQPAAPHAQPASDRG
ncbi:hypothetical protein LOD50_11700, partial [Xylella fastidiosa subsp. multiplex]|uniref:hypothetical protein n=3 Tax=Xylella fastidiosa TaxID=2371 RepID=UPI0023604CC4